MFHLIRLRYLNKGCSQYFCTKESDKALGADRKSAEHAKRGPLSDPMLDDAKYFGKLDDGLKKLGMSDAVSECFSSSCSSHATREQSKSQTLGFEDGELGSSRG